MFFKLFLVSVFVAICTADSCLHCICKKESGCKKIGCNPDAGSLSCGYYQIKRPYYIDCGTPGIRSGESIDTAWKRCADDYNCATTCVQNYVKRYSGKCPGKGSCEKMARLHNGGPNGCKTSATNGYWNSVKSCCHCS
uniref:lysozyme n=1 Tax=Acrobeloides nanus TaxID=290746 RepID=A0A914D6L3_9BILA